MVFAGYSGFLQKLWLASHDLPAIWQKKWRKAKLQIVAHLTFANVIIKAYVFECKSLLLLCSADKTVNSDYEIFTQRIKDVCIMMIHHLTLIQKLIYPLALRGKQLYEIAKLVALIFAGTCNRWTRCELIIINLSSCIIRSTLRLLATAFFINNEAPPRHLY